QSVGGKNSESLADQFRVVSRIGGKFRDPPRGYPFQRHQRTQGEGVSLHFHPCPLAYSVIIRGRRPGGCVQQVMRKFVKHHEQLLLRRQAAVDRDKVPSHHAVVKTAHFERHFGHGYL